MEKILINFLEKEGPVKAMNGVNNGPISSDNVRANGNSDEYKAAKIPFARLHDSAYCAAYGYDCVDVHRIFRDFDADVDDPASYNFASTDAYVKSILDAGTDVIYRLGACIEHEEKVGTQVPKDYHKWAEICAHIIRHLNDGWADGHHFGLTYFEIWNEPDCKNADGSNPCWQGTPEQFADFFEVVAKYLQAEFPDLMIGGPAFCDMYNPLTEYYLAEFQKRNVKLDFISYHRYCYTVDNFVDYVRMSNDMFAKYGYGDLPKQLNEFNYNHGWLGKDYKKSLRTISNLKGASFMTGIMCAGQHEDLDVLCYYDARPSGFNGLFSAYYFDPLKPYYAFRAFGELRDCKDAFKVEVPANIYAAAAWDGKNGGILMTYFDDEPEIKEKEIELRMMNPGKKVKAEYYVLDDENDMTLFRTDIFTGTEFTAFLKLPLYTTFYVKLTEEA